MIASAAFIVRTCLELVLYIVLLCGRDPSGWQQLVLSKNKKLQSSKGVFHGNRGNPPGSATEYSVSVIGACLGYVA